MFELGDAQFASKSVGIDPSSGYEWLNKDGIKKD